MSNQPHSTTAPEVPVEQSASTEFLTHCYANAIERLNKTYAERSPVAIVIGEGKSASSFVIGKFLDGLGDEASVVRVTEPCADATSFLGQIVRAVGFEPKDMGVSDLESVFKMFLAFQKSHDRRTVVCIEEIQDSEWWVLDKVRRLVETEVEGEFGFVLVISGQPNLKELLHTRPLSAVCMHAGQPVSLAPFTLVETTDYLQRRVEGATAKSVDQVFHYQAITLVHELCAGVPDAVSALVSLCMNLADEGGVELVTTDLVKRAYELQRADIAPDDVDVGAATVNLTGLPARTARLVVQISGEVVQESKLCQGHLLIGRSKLCDIQVPSQTVSRHHALISYTADGAILSDLNSTNGTTVDGYAAKYHSLSPGETIGVGDATIEYVLEDERHSLDQELLDAAIPKSIG